MIREAMPLVCTLCLMIAGGLAAGALGLAGISMLGLTWLIIELGGDDESH